MRDSIVAGGLGIPEANPSAPQLVVSIFRHLKLELLTQNPTSNEEKYLIYGKFAYVWGNELFHKLIIFFSIFRSFKGGIANAISGFK